MRLRVRLRSLALVGVLSVCLIVYNFFSVHMRAGSEGGGDPRLPLTRVARITAEDLAAIGHYTGAASITSAPGPTVSLALFNTTSPAQDPCDSACQLQHLQRLRGVRGLGVLKPVFAPNKAPGASQGNKQACDRACRVAQLRGQGVLRRGGYSSRVQVENMTLPDSWTVTQEIIDRLNARRSHVQEVCHKYGLDKANKTYQPNAWEFLINKQHGLVWCNVFKAASSTWFYNFNLLAGFTETHLLHTNDSPIHLARQKYKRPTVQELQVAVNASHPPLTFMIVRHPLERLVSAYRDKILSGNRFYLRLSRKILKQYPEMGKGTPRETVGVRPNVPSPYSNVASFPQFVQYLLDESAKGAHLDEHWTPMTNFCTPCLVPFDVFAKMETLEEDGNYIIFSAGIEDIIKPKRINRSRSGPTETVADRFLCQLSPKQVQGLLHLYKYDLELFEYDVSKYKTCTEANR